MRNKKFVVITLCTILAMSAGVAWLAHDAGSAEAWGTTGWLSDKVFAKRISGQFFNAGLVQIGIDGDGNPVTTNRGFTWVLQQDGTYIHEDSGAFESDEFFDLILAPYGLTLAALGIDIEGVMSTGIGRWERTGAREAGVTIVKYKYSSQGTATLMFTLKSLINFDEDYQPISQQFQLAYYNLVDLVNPFAGGVVQPALTLEEVNAIMDPDPANRPQPWFCYTSPPASATPDGSAGGTLLPVDATLSCQ